MLKCYLIIMQDKSLGRFKYTIHTINSGKILKSRVVIIRLERHKSAMIHCDNCTQLVNGMGLHVWCTTHPHSQGLRSSTTMSVPAWAELCIYNDKYTLT